MASLPPEVVAFIEQKLKTLQDLQVLLACVSAQETWWDADGMAREIGSRPAQARRSLEQLTRMNLLDVRITADVRYRFSPGTPSAAAAALAFGAAYRANPIAVVQLVTDGERRSARDFADAFRIR